MTTLYLGYVPENEDVTRHIPEAIAHYRLKTGHDATVIVVREEAPEEYDLCPIVVRSRMAMSNGMLITHVIGPDAINTPARRQAEAKGEIHDLPVAKVNLFEDAPDRYEAPKRMPGRPQRSGGYCPHCHGKVADFNRLGWWWGWEKGIFPPYWNELRDYVFQRDDYTCQECHRRFSKGRLVAHHIKHKEQGGEDSARNLATMCIECHPDDKPILSDEEEMADDR